jgi:hypothetical protein
VLIPSFHLLIIVAKLSFQSFYLSFKAVNPAVEPLKLSFQPVQTVIEAASSATAGITRVLLSPAGKGDRDQNSAGSLLSIWIHYFHLMKDIFLLIITSLCVK